MLMLKILAVLGVLVAVLIGLAIFNEHCIERFGHAFFTRAAFYQTAAALVLILVGNLWRESAARQHGDVLNGEILMGAGVGIAIWLIYRNFKRTNVAYGIGGSVLQIGVFSLLTWISIPILIFGLLCWFLMVIFSTQAVYVVNR
jgi:hypothetical protein